MWSVLLAAFVLLVNTWQALVLLLPIQSVLLAASVLLVNTW
jgi:hypothetical protein